MQPVHVTIFFFFSIESLKQINNSKKRNPGQGNDVLLAAMAAMQLTTSSSTIKVTNCDFGRLLKSVFTLLRREWSGKKKKKIKRKKKKKSNRVFLCVLIRNARWKGEERS